MRPLSFTPIFKIRTASLQPTARDEVLYRSPINSDSDDGDDSGDSDDSGDADSK